MRRRPEVFIVSVLLIGGLTVFLTMRACRRAPNPMIAPAAAVVASPPAPETFASSSSAVAGIPPIPQPADEIALIDVRDPAYAEALARIEQWFVRYLSEVDFVDGLTDQQLGVLVRKLAVARLSQSVYEAQIATVESKPDGAVVISVPAYERAGARLADYVGRDLLRNMTDPRQRQRIQLQFFGYGLGSQSFTVSVMRDRKGWNDESIYQIVHRIDAVAPNTPMTLGSGLAIRELGQYAPLARFFPQP